MVDVFAGGLVPKVSSLQQRLAASDAFILALNKSVERAQKQFRQMDENHKKELVDLNTRFHGEMNNRDQQGQCGGCNMP